MTEILTRKYHAALWQMGGDGRKQIAEVPTESQSSHRGLAKRQNQMIRR
jgi:hypothetical protein